MPYVVAGLSLTGHIVPVLSRGEPLRYRRHRSARFGGRMFKALVLEKDDAGFRADAEERRRERACPKATSSSRVDHSTLNYKDALAITDKSPIVRSWPMVAGHRRRGHGARVDAMRAGSRATVVVHNGWGVGETRWGCLAERARLKGELARPAAVGAVDAAGDGDRHRRLHRDALRARARAPRRARRRTARSSSPARRAASAASPSRCSRALGHRVVAATGKTSEAGYLRELGAAEVIDRATLAAPGKPMQKERWAATSTRSAATRSPMRSRRRATAASSPPAAWRREPTCRRR